MFVVKIILLSGKAGSGKNTVADFIQDYYSCDNHNVVKMTAFADALKKLALDLGWDGKKDRLGRQLLQQLGACGRTYCDTVWVDKAIELIAKTAYTDRMDNSSTNTIYCVTDVRYPNEIVAMENFFKSFENVSILKVRVDRCGDYTILTEEQRNDSSETSLDDYVGWDKVFKNSRDLKFLNSEVVKWLKSID